MTKGSKDPRDVATLAKALNEERVLCRMWRDRAQERAKVVKALKREIRSLEADLTRALSRPYQ